MVDSVKVFNNFKDAFDFMDELSTKHANELVGSPRTIVRSMRQKNWEIIINYTLNKKFNN